MMKRVTTERMMSSFSGKWYRVKLLQMNDGRRERQRERGREREREGTINLKEELKKSIGGKFDREKDR